MSEPTDIREIFNARGFPQTCWETCGTAEDCLLTGCDVLRIMRENARREQLLKEARAH